MPTNRRRWVAAALTFLQPGVGHLYLREWSRAATWFLLWAATALFATGISTAPAASVAAVVAFGERFVAALSDLEMVPSLALAAVTGFAVVDAYWLAARREEQAAQGPTCPDCGKEIDPSLEFCHWCTRRLDGGDRPSR